MYFSVSNFVASLALLAAVTQAIPTEIEPSIQERSDGNKLKFSYGNSKVRGVNIGGWLVLEPWITPSLFQQWSSSKKARDEYTFCKVLGKTEALRRLKSHWASWITQDDFYAIKKAGLNHVRIPIGYWSVLPRDGDPYVQGAKDYLSKAVTWAEKAGLNVMIDLHGAVGSQNGFDNSGRAGTINWGQPGDRYNTVGLTIQALAKLRYDFAGRSAVTAIELLNEPLGGRVPLSTIQKFYGDGWYQLRKSHVGIVIHDAFQSVTSWNSYGQNLTDLVLDTHHYEIFSDGEVGRSLSQHISSVCAFGRQMAAVNKPTINGEWTGALTDCAKWLNGLGKGARYNGQFPGSTYHGSCARKYTGTVSGFTAAEKANTRRWIEAQLDASEKADGWIFWTWKTESAPEWNMKALLAGGLFPQPLSSRQYPGQCN